MNEADTIALRDLDWNWGQVYDIAVTRDGWTACRLDNRRWLVGGSAAELHGLIVADYATQPAAREHMARQP
jgi:hypothetical protein